MHSSQVKRDRMTRILAFSDRAVIRTRRSRSCDRTVAYRRSLSALVITEAELRLIASAAIIGDSSQPVSG